jgi:hypothetical protein
LQASSGGKKCPECGAHALQKIDGLQPLRRLRLRWCLRLTTDAGSLTTTLPAIPATAE